MAETDSRMMNDILWGVRHTTSIWSIRFRYCPNGMVSVVDAHGKNILINNFFDRLIAIANRTVLKRKLGGRSNTMEMFLKQIFRGVVTQYFLR